MVSWQNGSTMQFILLVVILIKFDDKAFSAQATASLQVNHVPTNF